MKLHVTEIPDTNYAIAISLLADGIEISVFDEIDYLVQGVDRDDPDAITQYPAFSPRFEGVQRTPNGNHLVRMRDSRTFKQEDAVRLRTELDTYCNIYLARTNWSQGIFEIPKMKETAIGKEGGLDFVRRNPMQVLAQVVMPFYDSPVEDWGIRITASSDFGYHQEGFTTTSPVESQHAAYGAFVDAYTPTVSIAAAQKEGYHEVSVSIPNLTQFAQTAGVKRVFLKANGGVLGTPEVMLDEEGRGKTKWLPMGLDAGQAVTIEAGFKFYSNAARVEVAA